MEDVMLLEAVANQDQTALAAIFDKYSQLVYTIALRVLHEPDLAEDVMQEVLLQVWRQPGGFLTQRGSLGTWLALVARNRSIDVIRRRAHRMPLEELVLPEPKNLPWAVEDSRKMDRVKRAVETLSNEQQSSLQLVCFDGLAFAEIAERTATPLETVRTSIRTALATMREALGA